MQKIKGLIYYTRFLFSGFWTQAPRFCLLFSFFCFLLLSGCAGSAVSRRSDPSQIPALEPAAMLKLNDIPVPANFIFVAQDSYAFQSSEFRAGLLRYQGKASGDQTVIFFKEQMPMYNWRLINIVEYGRRMLTFEKDQESCVVTIDGKDNRLDVVISVGPKSQALHQQRRSDKPIK